MYAQTPFGQTADGTPVDLFVLTNKLGATVSIANYGGTVVSIRVPDKSGSMGEVLLGFDALDGYMNSAYTQANPYFGALIGRYGNRIRGGQFWLDGESFQLSRNKGPHTLHGGRSGFDRVVWKAVAGASADGQTLTLTHTSPDGDQGFPGKLDVQVTYTWTDANALRIAYQAVTDKPTVVNLTNHAYFNLNVEAGQDVLGHEVILRADRYTLVDEELMPTGELRNVLGTPFDFTRPHAIGERIAQVPGGYDYNWVLNEMGA